VRHLIAAVETRAQFWLGRGGVYLVPILLVSARLPPRAVAPLAACMLATYLALQPAACHGLLASGPGLSDHFDRVRSAWGAVPPPRARACAHADCVVVMSGLYTAVIALSAALVGVRVRGVEAWAAVAAAAAAARPAAAWATAGPCPASASQAELLRQQLALDTLPRLTVWAREIVALVGAAGAELVRALRTGELL